MLDAMGASAMVDSMIGINHWAWIGVLPAPSASMGLTLAKTSSPISPSRVLHFPIFHPLFSEFVALTENPMPDEQNVNFELLTTVT
jgi:hypothetical protein